MNWSVLSPASSELHPAPVPILHIRRMPVDRNRTAVRVHRAMTRATLDRRARILPHTDPTGPPLSVVFTDGRSRAVGASVRPAPYDTGGGRALIPRWSASILHAETPLSRPV